MTPALPNTPIRTPFGWLKLLASPVGAAALTSAAALAASALVFRVLPEAVAGTFALLSALVQTVLILGGMGQFTLTLRLYSRAEPGAFRWAADLAGQALFTLVPSAGLALLIGAIYALPPAQTLFLLSASLLWGAASALGSMLASQRRYALGSALPRLPNGLMLLPVLTLWAIPALATLPGLLAGQLLAAAGAVVIGAAGMATLRGRGERVIRPRERIFGLVFLASQSATLVPDSLLLAAAGFLVPAEDLALFAAVALLFKPVQLVQTVLAQVLTTELARSAHARPGRALLLFLTASVLILAAGIVAGPAVVQLVYGGRYTPSLALIGGISLAGALDVLETLPRSTLIARAPRRLLAWFSGAQLAIAGGGLVLGLALISRWGIDGAAIGAAAIFAARNTASFAGYALVRRRERSTRI